MSSVPCDLSASALSGSALSTGAARADALFASALQRSDEPSPGQVRRAIAALTTRGLITWGPAPPWSPRRRRWQGAS
jgi:hypothetical protein